MKVTKHIIGFIAIAILGVSCTDDSVELVERNYTDGILISGEGSGAGTGSVTYLSSDQSIKHQFIYLSANGLELGTYLQSMTFNNETAYIVVDNSNTVTVVDRSTFIKTGEITEDLSVPRFMAIADDKGYVTNWGDTSDETDDFIAVVDLDTNKVEKTISVGNGPEQIVTNDGKLYVSHKGAYSTNNIVSVIDIASEEVIEITVEDNPDELLFNSSGNLVVLSSGRTIYNDDWSVAGNTIGSIQTINVNTNAVVKSLDFEEGEHPDLLTYDNGELYYYLSGNVYVMDEDADVLPTTELISQYLYGMAVKDGELYGVNASFTAQSDLYIFDIETKEELYTTKVSLGASKIYFTE